MDHVPKLTDLPPKLAKLRDRATQGDARSAVKLGDAHYRGEGIAEDFDAARTWYLRAAELGDVDAMVNLVYFFSKGDGARWTQPKAPAPPTAAALAEAIRWATAANAKGRDQTSAIAALAKQLAKARTGGKAPPRTSRTQRAGLTELIASAKLARIGAEIEASCEDSIRLTLRAGAGRVGTSRIGGRPDLPKDQPWPLGATHPLSFIAQIDLAEVAPLDKTLPRAGLLSFFWDAIGADWGMAPESASQFRVLYTEPGRALAKAKPPKGLVPAHEHMTVEFAAHGLEPTIEITLPFSRTTSFRAIGATAAETNRYLERVYGELTALSPAGPAPCHRMFGHPDALQGDMPRRIAYARAGKLAQIDGTPIAALEKEATTYRLLLQIDTDAAAGTNWGEGRLYFWIRKADLRAKRFDAAWIQFQQ